MSDANQPYSPVLPILSIDVGPRLLPVALVLDELDSLDSQKKDFEAKIGIAEQEEDAEKVSTLKRQLASVDSAIKLRDDSIKIRHGHLHRRPAANSA